MVIKKYHSLVFVLSLMLGCSLFFSHIGGVEWLKGKVGWGDNRVLPNEELTDLSEPQLQDSAVRTWQHRGAVESFALCEQENQYLAAREPKALKALNVFLGLDDSNKKLVRLAYCGSRGSTAFENGVLEALNRSSVWPSLLNVVCVGELEVRYIFSKLDQMLTLESLQERVNGGDVPLPIFTAAMLPSPSLDQNTKAAFPLWVEMTPYEFACYKTAAAVGSDQIGSIFDKGMLVEQKPPLTLAQVFAICGLTSPTVANEPLKWEINNSVFGLTQSPFAQVKTFDITDSSVISTIPLAPLLQRDGVKPFDCIIVVDPSGDGLEQAKAYAQQNALRFPDMQQPRYKNYKTDPFTLFGAGDNNALLILYIPLVKNPLFAQMIEQFSGAWRQAFRTKIVPAFKFEHYANLLAVYEGNKGKNAFRENMDLLKENIELVIKTFGLSGKIATQKAIDHVRNMLKSDYAHYAKEQAVLASHQALSALKAELLSRVGARK